MEQGESTMANSKAKAKSKAKAMAKAKAKAKHRQRQIKGKEPGEEGRREEIEVERVEEGGRRGRRDEERGKNHIRTRWKCSQMSEKKPPKC